MSWSLFIHRWFQDVCKMHVNGGVSVKPALNCVNYPVHFYSLNTAASVVGCLGLFRHQ